MGFWGFTVTITRIDSGGEGIIQMQKPRIGSGRVGPGRFLKPEAGPLQ